MSPAIATFVFAVGILALLISDRDGHVHVSPALWISVAWFSIACSRPVTLWVQANEWLDSANSAMDGSPLDALVFACLLITGTVVVVSRRQKIAALLSGNKILLLFFCYAALSLLWSDFPGVALKRWVKALGDVVMLLIVVSERDSLAAIKRLLATLAFVLIPASVLLTKYYPGIGIAYNEWTGTPVYTGVTISKNSLGAICLCLGLAVLWRLTLDIKELNGSKRTKHVVANVLVLLLVLRLFQLMNSMTSLFSFLMASTLLLAASVDMIRRNSWVVHSLMALMLIASASILFLGVSPDALHAIGRNPTLTERTELWGQLLKQVQDPVLGTGFESFWLGPRLEAIWRVETWLPNEAHNGYLEVFLNLGWVGIALLAAVIAATYKSTIAAWRKREPIGNLRLSYFFVGLVFNFTEAAFFRMQAVVWLFFLLAAINVPGITGRKTKPVARFTPPTNGTESEADLQLASRLLWPELVFPANKGVLENGN